MAPSEINQNPFQGEFFSSSLPERFVRESIQNSLDAGTGVGPVRVRFAISGEESALSPVRASRYLLGLEPHVGAVLAAESEGVDGRRRAELEQRESLFKLPMPFLVVEDFGTTGLRGDIKANDIEERDNDFWGFFRSIGISPKPEDAGGSWGLGKWVFPDASRLNAFIGVTRRTEERRFLMMGQAMLKMHRLGERRYPPVGFFAEASDEEDEDWLPMPVDEDTFDTESTRPNRFLRDAMADFGLRPDGRPGTSVVIPHPDKELMNLANLAQAVIQQYFHPIVAGGLEVEVVSPVETVTIDATTITDEARRIWGETENGGTEQTATALVRAIELDRWGLSQRQTLVEVDGRRRQPPLAADRVGELQERYEKGERLAFQILPGGRWNRKPNAFRLFIERDSNLAVGHDYFVRGNLHIPRMDYLGKHRARALVVVDNRSDLGHLLRDSEGPAHERWRGSAARLRKRGWPNAAERVWEVQNAARRILDAFVEKPTEVDRHMLADLFPSDVESLRARGQPKPPKPRPKSIQKSPFRITGNGHGFQISSVVGHDLTEKTLSVRMAYDVARGSAQSAFNAFRRGLKRGCPDFSLLGDGLRMEASECDPAVVADNELRCRVTASRFSLDVTGFDSRDVVVQVDVIDDVAAADVPSEPDKT